MSREQQELKRLARDEAREAWTLAKRIPGSAGGALRTFAREHPMIALGGAAALAMGIVGRRHRKAGREGKPSSWLVALATVGVRMLPELLHQLGRDVHNAPVSEGKREPSLR